MKIVTSVKRYIVLIGAVVSLLLCMGCAAKLKNPVIKQAGGMQVVPCSHVSNERMLFEGERANRVEVSGNGNYLAVLQVFGDEKIVEAQGGWQFPLEDDVRFQEFSPDGERMAVIKDKQIQIIELKTRQVIREWNCKSKPRKVSFSSDGEMITFSSSDGIFVKNINDGKVLFERNMKSSYAVFSPDSKRLAVSTRNNAGGNPTEYVGLTVWLLDASFGVFADDEFRVFDLASGQLVFEKILHDQVVSIPTFSPDGRYVAVVVKTDWETVGGAVINVYDTISGRKVYYWDVSEQINTIVFSPDSKSLALAAPFNMGGVQVYDLESGQPKAKLDSYQYGHVQEVSFSPDSRYLGMAVWGRNGALLLYDLVKKQIVYSNVDDEGFYSVSFFPDGNSLAAGGANGVRLVPLAELK
nr:hypothetical protein [Pseudodesulfovibrio sp.]